ncbi:hypothetical protein XH98_06580 [Bradyrhizobium sp. CCBAU 51745]|nr:hypothetical protein [Bradyrhizobium sp. CCBAU 51745]
MQFVQFLQVSDCRYLQETEIIFCGIRKIGDVAIEGGTPSIVLADVVVSQQVVPPSKRTGAFYGLRTHVHLPKDQRKTDDPFRSANLSDVILFRSCAARSWTMSMLQLQPSITHSVNVRFRTAFERTHFEWRVCPNDRGCVPQKMRLHYARDFPVLARLRPCDEH